MIVIRSRQNAQYKALKLISKKGPYKDHFLVEGLRLCESVIQSKLQPVIALFSESFVSRQEDAQQAIAYPLVPGIEHVVLADDLFKQLTHTDTPQGIGLLVPRPKDVDCSFLGDAKSVIVLDRVQDPGNVGTLIRLAAALDFSAVVLLQGTADPFDSKTLRSAMGATFQIPLVNGCEWADCDAWLRQRSIKRFAADLGGQTLDQVTFEEPFALVLGNEGNGIRAVIREQCDERISIPLSKGVESLNVAIAGAIIAYQMKYGQ